MKKEILLIIYIIIVVTSVASVKVVQTWIDHVYPAPTVKLADCGDPNPGDSPGE